jgi:hypothetical protein
MEAFSEDFVGTFVTVEDISKSLHVEPVKSFAHDRVLTGIETNGVAKGDDRKTIKKRKRYIIIS